MPLRFESDKAKSEKGKNEVENHARERSLPPDGKASKSPKPRATAKAECTRRGFAQRYLPDRFES